MTVCQLSLGKLDTNCYIVWSDNGEAFVIDPADEAERILRVIEEKQITVKAVILTHVHFDHMLAARAVCDAVDAPLWVGSGDEVALGDPMKNLSGLFSPGNEVRLRADRFLREGDTLTIGNTAFTVWETPGHTPGCICLIGETAVFSGDVLFCGSIGRTDFPGGDVPAMMNSLRRLVALPSELAVYSGHGPVTTIGREKQTNPFLR